MSKSVNFPNELIIDSKAIISDKDSDGKMRSIELVIDHDYNYNEMAFGASDMLTCNLLKYYDKWNSYYLNCCAGSYFCDESYL